MNYTFADYENAILSALAPLGSYLKTLKGYSGQFDDRSVWEQFLANFPGVLVEIAAAEYTPTNLPFPPLICMQTVTAQLYLGSLSWRDQKAARSGGVEVVGVYTILNDIRKYLQGKTLGLEIRPLAPQAEFKINHDLGSRVVLYGARYQIINDRIMEE